MGCPRMTRKPNYEVGARAWMLRRTARTVHILEFARVHQTAP
jgi:hypothetical protein